jgi:hypothetical protein
MQLFENVEHRVWYFSFYLSIIGRLKSVEHFGHFFALDFGCGFEKASALPAISVSIIKERMKCASLV